MDMQLSFKIISILDFETPALFIPSKAIPPVMPPSPITAMCCFLCCFLCLEAVAIPSAADIDVEE